MLVRTPTSPAWLPTHLRHILSPRSGRRSCSRIAADRSCARKTRSSRSTTACRSVPTGWSSTSGCRATACRWCTTTRRWIAPRAGPGRCRHTPRTRCSNSMPGTTSPASTASRGAQRGCVIPRLEVVLARYPAVPIIMELKGDDPEVARRAVALVRGAGAIGRVCFAGFEDAVVRAARDAGTGRRVECGAARRSAGSCTARGSRWHRGARPSRPSRCRRRRAPLRVVSRRFVRAARRAGVACRRMDRGRAGGDGAPAGVGRPRPDQRSSGSGGASRASLAGVAVTLVGRPPSRPSGPTVAPVRPARRAGPTVRRLVSGSSTSANR